MDVGRVGGNALQNGVEVAPGLAHGLRVLLFAEVPAGVVAGMVDAPPVDIDQKTHTHVGRVVGMDGEAVIAPVLVVVQESDGQCC